MALPKNSGFQIGAMSLISPPQASLGMNGSETAPEEPLEERTVVRVEERAVLVERPVLNDDGNLIVPGARLVAGLWRRLRKLQRILDGVADDIETRQPGVDGSSGSSPAHGRGTTAWRAFDRWSTHTSRTLRRRQDRRVVRALLEVTAGGMLLALGGTRLGIAVTVRAARALRAGVPPAAPAPYTASGPYPCCRAPDPADPADSPSAASGPPQQVGQELGLEDSGLSDQLIGPDAPHRWFTRGFNGEGGRVER